MNATVDGQNRDSHAGQRLVDVAVYGIINAGKSSLINALAGREVVATGAVGGTTKEVTARPWREVQAEVGPFVVRLIDTPGLQEVGTPEREAAAWEAARWAELVVFVIAEDLTASALDAIDALKGAGKPILVALNKVDLLDQSALAGVMASVQGRLAGLIPPEHVFPIAAAPLERRFGIGPDGQARLEMVHGPPRIEALEAGLVAAIEQSAATLRALNQMAAQVDQHLQDRQADRARRRARAEQVADETSVGMALALAANPIPWLDFLASSGGLAVLVKRVAGAYGASSSPQATHQVAKELMRAGGRSLWGSLAAVGVGGMLKFIPGLGHLTGALAQAVAGGYVAHVLGRALVDYYENNCDWGSGGVRARVNQIAAETDRIALTRGLADKLKARLGERR